jgi:hypothetical protein
VNQANLVWETVSGPEIKFTLFIVRLLIAAIISEALTRRMRRDFEVAFSYYLSTSPVIA